MLQFFRKDRNLPRVTDFALQSYTVDFSLDRLVPGVDNVRLDVALSSTFTVALRKIIVQNIVRHVDPENREAGAPPLNWAKEVEGFKLQYADLMRNAVNKAKGAREAQIVNLAHTAVWKQLLEDLRAQFDLWVGQLKKQIRGLDLAVQHDSSEAPRRKVQLQRILQNRQAVLLEVGIELSQIMAEVEEKEIRPVFEANFGPCSSFVADVFASPMLHQDQPDNEFFLIEHYDLVLGRRIDDPDKYEALLALLRGLVYRLGPDGPSAVDERFDPRPTPTLDEDISCTRRRAWALQIESWLKVPANIDHLLNYNATLVQRNALKKEPTSSSVLEQHRKTAGRQKRLVAFFFRAFKKNGLMERIGAVYEMRPEYREYCPPLAPQQILNYLAQPGTRRLIRRRLKRLQKLYGKSFSLRPLNKKIKSMEQMTTARQKAYLVRFLSALVRYHRDVSNLMAAREAMERVRLVKEERISTLSRENNTLYEFLLSHETVVTSASIINHVVIKVDVRGSTDITYQMNARGLNPAAHFSLNLFDPITELLAEYDAGKIFLEGDAIIMAIFERENTPEGWYGVARACGLALNILAIIRRYNEKNLLNRLPVLELGIGISYQDRAPTFLFDGSRRIMISPAINQADRLCSSSRSGRRLAALQKGPFNLFVFQTVSDDVLATTQDDLYIRYNVNGIELSTEGFAKLAQEIDLKPVRAGGGLPQGSTISFYTGTFPTRNDRYHRLVIREALIPVVDPATLEIVRFSARKYYEVCTHPQLDEVLFSDRTARL